MPGKTIGYGYVVSYGDDYEDLKKIYAVETKKLCGLKRGTIEHAVTMQRCREVAARMKELRT
uniref:Uncharacterized protein n=1 Tax=candidate division CPR3 bacterium TaxID=2268181 RepID=A0A7C4M144_UNCC3